MSVPVKTSDIPEAPILALLAASPGVWHTHNAGGGMPTVLPAFPNDTPPKLVLSKMRTLLKRGLVDGCGCGCRGDWRTP